MRKSEKIKVKNVSFNLDSYQLVFVWKMAALFIKGRILNES